MQVLNSATQYGVFLPFSRTQESEADSIGVLLMARAGFDPASSITLWENMSVGAGPSPPELLSTHPSPSSRIEDLENRLSEATPLFQAARESGLSPDCSR